ncbi:MAG: hypothetical protein IJ672_06860, partial [Methanobrevibacter sp.]|nr:hypothetical protein [Methanobrevibacter sp.]
EFQNYIQMSDENSNGIDATASLGDIRGLEKERRVVVGATNNHFVDDTNNHQASYNNPYEFDNPYADPYGTDNQYTANNITNENHEIHHEFIEKPIEEKPKQVSESEKLLNKLFEKIDINPKLKIDLDCAIFPSKELNMLQTIYDVTVDDISDYIVKHIINIDVFKSAVTKYVNEQLTN